MADKIWYSVPDFQGNPTRVPADKVDAFLKQQEKLKTMKDPSQAVTPELKAEVREATLKYIQKLREKQNPQK